MPIDRSGRFTSQKQYSRWDIMQAQRQFHAQASQKYLNSASDALSALQTAFSNQITGTGNLTATIALKRIQTTTALARQAARGIDIST
jgi:hypothetical protein